MKATLYPDVYIVRNNFKDTAFELLELHTATRDKAEAAIKGCHVYERNGDNLMPIGDAWVEKVDIIVCSPAGSKPMLVQDSAKQNVPLDGFWVVKDPNGNVMPLSIATTDVIAFARAYSHYELKGLIGDMEKNGYTVHPVSVNIPNN